MGKSISITEAARFFEEHDNFLIISHANPDGDTLGCAFGLCSALQSIGKHARNICADELSKRYDFMKEAVREQEFEPQVYVTVDVADKKLLGDLEKICGDKIDLAVDHHVSHVEFARQQCVEPYAAACAQTVYKIINAMDIPLDKNIAACLYVGIATDSGCFKYSSVTPETHIIAAELLKFNFGFDRLNYIFFDMKTKQRIRLEEKIYSSMEYFCGGRCAMAVLTKEMLDGIDPEDSNGVSAIPRQIDGVEVGVIIKQKKHGWKASMRSNSAVDVQEICVKFGGGGHAKAAGCSFENTPVEDIKKQLAAEIEKVLQ